MPLYRASSKEAPALKSKPSYSSCSFWMSVYIRGYPDYISKSKALQEVDFFSHNPAVENKNNPPKTTGRAPRFLLLMPDDLRHAMDRAAAVSGRTLTAEINIRLKESLKPTPAPGIAPAPPSYNLEHPSNGGP
ncbi:hypothetical protein LP416_27740 [Polaromonas sp. P2-4]|nr:hypothetical protein LP416_27740 [Polaromonas sp. P2-4]